MSSAAGRSNVLVFGSAGGLSILSFMDVNVVFQSHAASNAKDNKINDVYKNLQIILAIDIPSWMHIYLLAFQARPDSNGTNRTS